MHIGFCQECKKYTLQEKCPACRKKTINPQPAKFSPEDKYGKYRRLQKKEMLKKE